MSLRNKNPLKFPKLNPQTPEDHRFNNNELTRWAQAIPLNERVTSAVRRTADQVITTTTVTPIQWQTIAFPYINTSPASEDLFSFFNASVDNTLLTCPQGLGGVYTLSFEFTTKDAWVNPHLGIRKNGLTICRFALHVTGGINDTIQTNTFINLIPDDTLQCWAYHESGANRTVGFFAANANADFSPRFRIARISE